MQHIHYQQKPSEKTTTQNSGSIFFGKYSFQFVNQFGGFNELSLRKFGEKKKNHKSHTHLNSGKLLPRPGLHKVTSNSKSPLQKMTVTGFLIKTV